MHGLLEGCPRLYRPSNVLVCVCVCVILTVSLAARSPVSVGSFRTSTNSDCQCSSGIENNPTVFYRLIRGSTAQTNKYDTFYLQQRADNGHTWADIKVNHPLDYENIKEYNLTIRVEVTSSPPLSSKWTH